MIWPDGGIDRREALKRLGALAAVPLVGAPACHPDPSPASDRQAGPSPLGPLGLQLYTLRSEMERDVAATLDRVAEIGYAEVEFAGYFGHTPAEIRGFLDAAGLRAPAAHVGPQLVEEAWPETLEAAGEVGHEWVVVPSVPLSMRGSLDDWRRTAERFTRAAEAARAAGLRFAYHNHDFEFRELEGRIPMHVFLETADPDLVEMELDFYWIVHAGGDPIAFIDRWAGRIPLVHVKDRTRDGRMVDVGAGAIDWTAVLGHRERAGIRHYFVEHDDPDGPFRSAAASYRYLSELEI